MEIRGSLDAGFGRLWALNPRAVRGSCAKVFFALARLRPNERRHKGHARSAARRPFPQKPVLLGGYDGRFERKMNFLRKRGFFGHRTSAYIPAPNKIARAENPGKSGKIRGGICVLQIGASPAVSRENFPKCEPDRVGSMRTEQKPPDLGKPSAAKRFGEPRPQFPAALSSLGRPCYAGCAREVPLGGLEVPLGGLVRTLMSCFAV